MPGAPITEILLTVKDIVALGRSERRVLLNKEKWGARPSGNGRNGKSVYLYPLNKLPEDLQRAYLAQSRPQFVESDNIYLNEEAPGSSPTVREGVDERELRLTAALQRLPLDVREAFLNEARRLNSIVDQYNALPSKRQRVANLEVVGSNPTVRASGSRRGTSMAELADAPDSGGRPAQKVRVSSGYDFTPAVYDLCKQTACTNETIIEYFKSRQHSIRKGSAPRCTKPVSPVTLDVWSRRLRKEGPAIFIPAPPKAPSADDSRLAKMPKEAAEWLLANWKNHPTVTQCYYRWRKAARKHNWRIPSLGWLTRWYRNIPTIAKAKIFLGDKVYTDKFKPFLPRTVRDLAALQILCGDHHVLDVLCWSESKKALVRLWFTCWLDLRTYLIYGWHLDYTPSSTTIGCAYANGVRMFGAQPPRRDGYQSLIYTDNGKDYRSRNISGLMEVHKQAAKIDGSLELLLTDRGVGLAQDADIEAFLARKQNGREKPMERVFRDTADYLQNEFFRTGWCGRNTKDRPDFFRDLYARHLKAIKAGRPSPFPDESVVRATVAEFVERHNTTAHTRTVLDGATTIPLQEHQSLYTTRYEIRDETLALMVMKKDVGVMDKNGVKVLGSHYWHDEIARFKGLKDKDGKALRIEVRYTDADYSTAWLVLPNGEMVQAFRVDLSSVVTPNKENLKAYANRVRAEQDLIKRAGELRQSIWRGETTWDRVAAEIEPAEEVVEAIAAMGGTRSPAFSGVHSSARMSGDNGLGGQMSPGTSGEAGSARMDAGPTRQASVTLLSPLDLRRRHHAPATGSVTVDHVAAAKVDESIFESESPVSVDGSGFGSNVVQMFEDED